MAVRVFLRDFLIRVRCIFLAAVLHRMLRKDYAFRRKHFLFRKDGLTKVENSMNVNWRNHREEKA